MLKTVSRFAAALFALVAAWTVTAEERLPVPSDVEQAEAMALLREVYGGEYERAEKPVEKEALAKALLERAGGTPDPVNRFALLRLARDVAVQGGSTDVAFAAIDELGDRYAVDADCMKLEALQKTSTQAATTDQRVAVAKQACTLLDAYADEGTFDVALNVGKIGATAAKRARAWDLTKQIETRLRRIRELASAYAEVADHAATLAKSATDPDANSAVGRYYCCIKRDWEKGLPLLALGNDPRLTQLAKEELNPPDDARGQIALGNRWSQMRDSEDEVVRRAALERAATWYETALPRVAGLTRQRLGHKLLDIWKHLEIPYPVCEWRRWSKDRRMPNITLYSNGDIDAVNIPRGAATWTLKGTRLELVWPRGSVDQLRVSPDGKTFSGKNSAGTAIRGQLVRGANLLKQDSVEEGLPVLRSEADEKDEQVLLGSWYVKVNDHEAIWTFHEDGSVTSTSGVPKGAWGLEADAVRIAWDIRTWDTLSRPLDAKGTIGESGNKGPKTVQAQRVEELMKELALKRERLKNAVLIVKSWHWTKDRYLGFVTVEGIVENNSGERLENVQVVATFYTRGGELVTSQESFITYNPVLSRQRSPFKVIVTYNPAMAVCELTFKFFAGGTIPTAFE